MIDLNKRSDGFTLIEVLVSVAIGLIVMAAVYSVYTTQQKSYILQEQVAGMQQNLRAAMFYMVRELRMAACDPTDKAKARILSVTSSSISFTCDIRGDAYGSEFDGDTNDANENITYSWADADGDGDMDIVRNTGGGNQPLAENIDELDFVYLNEDLHVLPFPVNISSIKSVEITIIARTDRVDLGFTNNKVYKNQRDETIYTAPGDSYRRKRLTTHIRFRNL